MGQLQASMAVAFTDHSGPAGSAARVTEREGVPTPKTTRPTKTLAARKDLRNIVTSVTSGLTRATPVRSRDLRVGLRIELFSRLREPDGMIGPGGQAVNHRLGRDFLNNPLRDWGSGTRPDREASGPSGRRLGHRSPDLGAPGPARGGRRWAPGQKLSLAPR